MRCTNALRFFVEGDPQAILVVELNGDSPEEANQKVKDLIKDLKAQGRGLCVPPLSRERK